MGRWEPNARGRLEKAALELYSERGFEQTTVAEIAKRAGLTERTFYRHFADKREVLFPDASPLQTFFVEALNDAPHDAAPIDTVGLALDRIGELFQGRRELARQRQGIVSANPELREREVTKMADLSDAAARTLRGRGVGDLAASLAAEIAVAVLKVAFERWLDDPGDRDFGHFARESLDEVRALAAGA
ncbi:TetR family transcriptional regulator [Streptomyces beihaiensis]|uniref:TetR/AcrR family transcriptional regulator n=1 Tax=Streptomyces beihaiensis TaxID=2984495 RepID=A0ABT3TXE0_9ACTN|nr:TetR family transcriptional regulator [Streptomyces beihaiensis]MCX3061714.1 TetR/AcrR family transcriptional regulator [Streptomyces beihaiensis]